MRMLILIQSVLLMMFVGCAQKQVRTEWIEPIVEFNADTMLVCDDPAAPGCAVPTAFDELLEKTSKTPAGITPHYVNLLNVGNDALLIRIHLIRAARKSIYIQQFIWVNDESGKYVFRELVKAARRGVEVKIISDQLTTAVDARDMAGVVVAHENLQVKLYNPTFDEMETSHLQIARAGIGNLSGINQRMHSKLLIVDEKIGILGGRNHQNMYFDRDPEYNFKDRDILVIGPAVQDMVRSFREYWDYEFSVPAQYLKDVAEHLKAGSQREYLTYVDRVDPGHMETHPLFEEIDQQASDYDYIRELFVEKAYRVEGQVEFFADPPGKPTDEKRDQGATWGTTTGIVSVVKEANSSLVIQTPYLLFTESGLSILKELREQHPDMEIIASTNSLAATDHFFTYGIAMKQKQRLLKDCGFHLFELKPVPGDVREINPRYDQLQEEAVVPGEHSGERVPVEVKGPITGLHAKSIVVDDHIAFVGSHNFDPRSGKYDTQVVVAIWDKQVALALKANILRDTEPQNSWVVAAQKQTPVVSPCLNCFSGCFSRLPVFDIWPTSYSSSFELREGMEPIPPDDPNFYLLYENVGQFPEVKDTGRVTKTWLYKAMGGFTTPLM